MYFISQILSILKKIFIRPIIPTRLHFLSMEQSYYSRYKVGKFSYCIDWLEVLNSEDKVPLEIGKFCSIGGGVTIILGAGHRTDWITTYPFSYIFKEFKNVKGLPATKGGVFIGNDVWIGKGATILSGVHIGDGAVVGTNSVVTKDVEPYTIVAGNPAKIIRKRFSQETINKLLEIKWWDWDLKKIKDNVPFLLSNKMDEFIDSNSKH